MNDQEVILWKTCRAKKLANEALTDEEGKLLHNIVSSMHDVEKLQIWSDFTSSGTGATAPHFVKSVHKHISHVILAVFGVPGGKAGVGVKPIIPDSIRRREILDGKDDIVHNTEYRSRYAVEIDSSEPSKEEA